MQKSDVDFVVFMVLAWGYYSKLSFKINHYATI